MPTEHRQKIVQLLKTAKLKENIERIKSGRLNEVILEAITTQQKLRKKKKPPRRKRSPD